MSLFKAADCQAKAPKFDEYSSPASAQKRVLEDEGKDKDGPGSSILPEGKKSKSPINYTEAKADGKAFETYITGKDGNTLQIEYECIYIIGPDDTSIEKEGPPDYDTVEKEGEGKCYFDLYNPDKLEHIFRVGCYWVRVRVRDNVDDYYYR